jgi:hypothetical protein
LGLYVKKTAWKWKREKEMFWPIIGMESFNWPTKWKSNENGNDTNWRRVFGKHFLRQKCSKINFIKYICSFDALEPEVKGNIGFGKIFDYVKCQIN